MNRALVCVLLASGTLCAAGPEAQSVYLLPMTGGLDQYLANRLGGVFRVVTDPKLADAIFTDQLGAPFEQRLAKLYPPAKAAGEKSDKDDKEPPKISSFGRGKGTIFLVDLKSRTVIWSAYQKSKGSGPEALDRTAAQIVEQIQKQQRTK